MSHVKFSKLSKVATVSFAIFTAKHFANALEFRQQTRECFACFSRACHLPLKLRASNYLGAKQRTKSPLRSPRLHFATPKASAPTSPPPKTLFSALSGGTNAPPRPHSRAFGRKRPKRANGGYSGQEQRSSFGRFGSLHSLFNLGGPSFRPLLRPHSPDLLISLSVPLAHE